MLLSGVRFATVCSGLQVRLAQGWCWLLHRATAQHALAMPPVVLMQTPDGSDIKNSSTPQVNLYDSQLGRLTAALPVTSLFLLACLTAHTAFHIALATAGSQEDR